MTSPRTTRSRQRYASTEPSSLFYAAEEGLLELVADLIKEGADVNEQNEAGNTAVERAQNAQTVEVLKAAGATMPEIPDKEKNTLLRTPERI